MKEIVESLKKNPKREYSLSEITTKRFIPWALNYRTIRAIIEKDRVGYNLLNTRVSGGRTAAGRRYTVRGEGIINYLVTVGPILLGTVRKSKTNGKRKQKPSGDL